jgi:hypothetical protein
VLLCKQGRRQAAIVHLVGAITNKGTGKLLAGLRPKALAFSVALDVNLPMKYLAFSFCLLILTFASYASVSRECNGSDVEIRKSLVALAVSAKKYKVENGSLPGVWSEGMSKIISDTPEIVDISGNINPGADGNSMDLMCSDIKLNQHKMYSINLTSHVITINQFKVVH